MEFYNFPWSHSFGFYNTIGWFSLGPRMIISLFLDHSSKKISSPGGPAVLNFVVTNIKYI